MARTLKFYGASDDLFEVDGGRAGEPDEIGCYDRPCVLKVSNEHGGLQIVGLYCDPGVWSVGVAQIDEDTPLPDWPIRFTWKGYSAILQLEAPDSVTIEEVGAAAEA